MKIRFYSSVIMLGLLVISSCNMQKEKKEASPKVTFTGKEGEIKLVVLDPGHFHASLLQKFHQKQVNDTVLVYAPDGNELSQYLASIEGYNNRSENPTSWKEVVYSGNDYLEKMLDEKKGNVVILAGNNLKKTEYISKAINAGYNVLSDKPMAINTENFELLKSAFDSARAHNVYLYDVMTERYDIMNAISREIMKNKELFGDINPGTKEAPAIKLESVHHFYKEVSGNTLVRPAWFYDVDQQGEGIADVATHLVDLVHWICFPDQAIDYENDIAGITAKHWPTIMTLTEFSRSTKLDTFPAYLRKYVNNKGELEVFANGTINYSVNGKNAEVTVLWNYQAPQGAGDTYNAFIRGTRASISIVQDKSTNYVEQLYILNNENDTDFENKLSSAVAGLQSKYPYIALSPVSNGKYLIKIPVENRKGHEDYFGFVARKFFDFLVQDSIPEWEVSNMLTKYYITTTALAAAMKN